MWFILPNVSLRLYFECDASVSYEETIAFFGYFMLGTMSRVMMLGCVMAFCHHSCVAC